FPRLRECGGSEVPIIPYPQIPDRPSFLPPNPPCGLLNQSHTRSTNFQCPDFEVPHGSAARACEIRKRNTSSPRQFHFSVFSWGVQRLRAASCGGERSLDISSDNTAKSYKSAQSGCNQP